MIKGSWKYQYRLREGSRKDVCPNCGRKTFTPYVNERGEILSEEVGICDRKNKCNYHYAPSEYRKAHHISGSHFIGRKEGTINNSNQRGMPREKYKAPSYISTAIFKETLDRKGLNALTIFLKNFFGKYGMEEGLESVLSLYCVANSKKYGGSPIFWQIDERGNVRDGKIMGYDAVTGKRIKHPYPKVNHVHSLLECGNEESRSEFQGCMFGSHIVRTEFYKGQPLWVFESEKAALIVATILKSGGCMLGIPVATGGCGALNPTESNLRDPYHRLRLLKGREVVLFPDEGKYEEWKEKGRMLRGFVRDVQVSSAMERKVEGGGFGVEIHRGDGLDDLLMRTLERGMDVYSLITECY